MFDPSKGNQKIADQVDESTDEFAALFTGLPPRQQLLIINKMNELLADPDDVQSFAAGSYAQGNNGSPAKQLGGGSSTPTSADEALQVIMASNNVPAGVKAAILRIITPGDPNFIEVEQDGTPKELKAVRTQRDAEKKAKEKAEQELADAKDDTKPNSLAKQLKDAKAANTAPATPADMVLKADVLALAEEAQTAVNAVKGKLGSKPDGLDNAKTKVKEVVDAVS